MPDVYKGAVIQQKNFRRDWPHGEWERGTSALEFALVALVLFTLLLGIIEIGRLLYIQQSVTSAAYEVARAAAGEPGLTNQELKQVAAARVPVLDTDALSIDVKRNPAKGEVTVTVSYPYEFIVPFIVPNEMTLTATVHFRY